VYRLYETCIYIYIYRRSHVQQIILPAIFVAVSRFENTAMHISYKVAMRTNEEAYSSFDVTERKTEHDHDHVISRQLYFRSEIN